MNQKHQRAKTITLFFFIALLGLLGFSSFATAKEAVVIGTVINQVPALPKTIKMGAAEVGVVWDNVAPALFNTVFQKVTVKGKAVVNGAQQEVEAAVWTLPDNLVYLIDAGTANPGNSQIFEAAKALRGEALQNELPDKLCTSDADKWGYVEQTLAENQKTHVTSGDENDWATSFISSGSNKGKGPVYKLTLKPGIYKVTVAHVPCQQLTYGSWLRVNNARVASKTLTTIMSEDKRHAPVYVTHDVRLIKPTVITYETDKVGGEVWDNANVSLLAVELISSNIAAPIPSPTGGDFWEPQTLSFKHRAPGAEIYYTLDGSKPDKNGLKYTAPVTVDKNVRVSAIAYVDGDASKTVSVDFAINTWAVTATAFKLTDETDVRNVKVNWMQREDADLYKIYRDGKLIGETRGDTYDDYALLAGKTYSYYVEAYKGGAKVATADSQEAATFTPVGKGRLYDNKDGKYLSEGTNASEGMKIGNLYFSYLMQRIEKPEGKGWSVTESYSSTGRKGTWSTPRELAFYPNVNFEGIGSQYNKKTGKVVLSAHYEDQKGYTAAKIYLAQITPKGGIEVGTMERPLGHDSRDQSVFVDDDGTAYLLSATNTNTDINIYRLDESWTKPVALVNTVFIGQHRETPAIIKKDGEYYFFSSKASGWYPSQAMYASSVDLGGVWTSLRELGNNSTFGAQSNSIRRCIGERETFGLWSYHWGAQQHHKDPDGNFPRVSVVSFNKGYASMDYYRYLEFHDKYGIIPVQDGRNLTLNAPVTATVVAKKGTTECVTDGADFYSSDYFQGGSCPYSLTIDMRKKARISEINLATFLVNGSETACQYTVEGSMDGVNYTMLVDGKENWQVGFQILKVEDASAYRYLRLNVMRVVNVHNDNPAEWAEGVYEFTAFGVPQ